MILFILHLYFTLPNYIPKGEPILFSCILGEECSKFIELSNPTTKQIAYWVLYEGHSDFQIENSYVQLNPKSITKFKISFNSRISNSLTGRIIFTNQKISNIQAAALVFDLKSHVFIFIFFFYTKYKFF